MPENFRGINTAQLIYQAPKENNGHHCFPQPSGCSLCEILRMDATTLSAGTTGVSLPTEMAQLHD